MTSVTGEDGALTFQAYADRIGKSRPYVSKLVALGRIRPPALTADRKILPGLADVQIADTADPAKGANGAPTITPAADGAFAQQRARLITAQAERAELELQARRGELIDRNAVAGVLGPKVRELRDTILGVPRDVVIDPVQAAECEAQISEALAQFSAGLAALAAEATSDDATGAAP